MDNTKYVIFHIQGGLGKNIAATAVLPAIKKKYPDRELIVVASWAEIFLYNPYVYRTYKLGATSYFYDDYIKDKDVVVLKGEPYDMTGHIKQEQHLIQSWHELFNLEYEDTWPELHSNYRFPQLIAEKYSRDRPIMVIQSNGGPMVGSKVLTSWSRDIPKHITQKLVNYYMDRYHIYQVAWDPKHIVQGVEPVIQPTWNMETLSLLKASQRRILIDSCLQHAAAAFKLPSTVLWVGTSPTVFGYDIHTNIVSDKDKLENAKNPHAYLFDYELWGDPIQCPYESDNLFDVAEIIKLTENEHQES